MHTVYGVHHILVQFLFNDKIVFFLRSDSKMARQGIPYLYTPPDNDNDLASIYREKYLCRSTGIQHHMPRDRGAVSLTSTLGNKQRDLGPGCRICGEPAPVFRAGDPGAHSETITRRGEGLCGSPGVQGRHFSTLLKQTNKTHTSWTHWRV